jgi:hypothetical protein
MFNLDNIKTSIALVSGLIAASAGGYKFLDSMGYSWNRPVLTWAPEHFYISDAEINDEFMIRVAREKHRSDCEVIAFNISIIDSDMMIYPATPGATIDPNQGGTVFIATEEIGIFAYEFYMQEQYHDEITPGEATFMARIEYDCPEGNQFVDYPPNLTFNILPISNEE